MKRAFKGVIVCLVCAVSLINSMSYAGWKAYNDCLTQAIGFTQPNVTTYTIYNGYTGNYTGPLKNFDTAGTAAMPTVTFSMEVGIGTSSVGGGAAGNPAPGTPADAVFGGIVDFSPNLLDYTSTGWAQIIEFSNLDPTTTYTFVGTAIRTSSYPGRKTLVTISGHQSADNTGSDGPMIVSKTADTTIFMPGNNTAAGDIVRWENINPGPDRTFTIRSEATADSDSGYKSYPINGFMLEMTGPVGNQPPQVNAGDDRTIIMPVHSLALDAIVTDDGLGDPDGSIVYQWSCISGPAEVTFKPDSFIEDPTVSFPLGVTGTYVLELHVTDGELETTDQVSITVLPPDCPLGDLTGDCMVDSSDLYEFGLQWLASPAGAADLSGDSRVDFSDYLWFAGSWRQNWQRGAVQVSILPEKVRGEGAQWRVDSDPIWRNHTDIVDDLPAGVHTIEFSQVPDWDRPDSVQVEVVYGETAQTQGGYVGHTGSLEVAIYPPNVLPQARWRRVGEIQWRLSGPSGREDNVLVGPHGVEFTLINGWLGPGQMEAVVEKDKVATIEATYTQLSGITLRINEFMADNLTTGGTNDEHGDPDDWIEIYNASDFDIDMAGMSLADDGSVWKIPATENPSDTTVLSKGFLIFWADGEVGEGPRHLPFKLGDGGDSINLFDSDGTTQIDSITFGSQLYGVSYGRFPDAANDWYFFTIPTPGTQNDQMGIANRVSDTKFDPNRGFYDTPIQVTITSDTPDAQIYYTTNSDNPILLDGTPTPSAQLYSGPIEISTTTCLRAAAVKADCIPTNIDTNTYIFLDDVLTQANAGPPAGYESYSWGHDGPDYEVDPDIVNNSEPGNRLTPADMRAIPTIVVCMPADDWFKYGQGLYVTQALDGTEYPCSFEYFDPDGNGFNLQQNCAMSMQGGISDGGTSLGRWKTDKLSNRPRFKRQTDNGTPTGGPAKLRAKIFPDSPVENFDSVVLDGVLNHSWLHLDSGQRNTAKYVQDQAVCDLHNAMMPGHSPHGAYAHVYINDLYWGMYYIHERPDHSWAAETFGGQKEEYDAVKHGNDGITGDDVINDGIGGAGIKENWDTMMAAANAAGDDPTNTAKWQTVEQLLDIDNVITYLLAHWFAPVDDWPAKNWYATHREGGQWRLHTWDAEHSFEGTNRVGASPLGTHAALDPHVEYRMRWADLIHKNFHNGGPLSYPRCMEIYQARVAQVNEAIRGESARWGDNRRQPPHNRLEWLGVNTQDGSYFTNRSANVFGWLKGAGLYPDTLPPDFEINGSPMFGGYVSFNDKLSITNPGASGAIWYTLNGNDPRLPGGAVNMAGGAIRFTGTDIPMTHSVQVKARVLNGTQWSAVSDAAFAVGPVARNLRITEIMFHPPDAPDGDPNAEFIELKNVGAQTINLSLVRFTSGIDLTLPYMQLAPDAIAVVVRDPVAFANTYDTGVITVVPVAYTGSLRNSGERIELLDALGNTIHGFSYNDKWYKGTDGQGLSINIRDPYNANLNDWDSNGGWKASSVLGGTPGRDDNGIGRGDIVVNEVLAHSNDTATDWIELYNTTDRPLAIGGMYLSDSDINDPNLTKYRIPDGTEIPKTGYIVISENEFGNPGFADIPFSLSENGDEVHLTQSVDGVLTILAEEAFGPSERNIAFGRYIKSAIDPGVNFVAMAQNTPGFANSDTKVDRLVISEIAYNPRSNGNAEYIELLNVSGAAVTLSTLDGDQWRIVDDPDPDAVTRDLEIKLPAVTLQKDERMLLVKNVSAFETVYLAGSSVNALGVRWLEWGILNGSLSNGREKLELQMPGDVKDGRRMYIRVDRVYYSDGSHPDSVDVPDPWPTEPDDSDSFTLTRITPNAYGNDAVNWQPDAPSPGYDTP